jgi:formate dehydrogenase iron-sulfur subunit
MALDLEQLLFGPEPDPAGDAGHDDHPPRMGFFTDTGSDPPRGQRDSNP